MEIEELNNVVVGLDIGTTKIVAMVGCVGKDKKVKILAYGKTPSDGVVKGAVQNVVKVAGTIKLAVEQAQNMFSQNYKSDLQIGSVYVGVASEYVHSRIMPQSISREQYNTPISEDDLNLMRSNLLLTLENSGEMVIDIVPKNFSVDNKYELSEDEVVGVVGKDITATYHVITAKREAINNIKLSVNGAGLEIDGFALEPLVSAESVLSSEEKNAGVVLVDIGGGTTDVAIFKNGVLQHTSVIPIAGQTVTSDIQSALSILPRQAESLKTSYGQAMLVGTDDEKMQISLPRLSGKDAINISIKSLSNIIEYRMKEVMDMVTVKIMEVEPGFLETKTTSMLAGIILTGGGSNLKYLDTLFETNLFDTRVGSPVNYISSECSEEVKKDLANPIFATSVGLVKCGIKQEEKQRREDLRKSKQVQTKKEEEQEVKEEKIEPIPAPEAKKEKKETWLGKGFGKTKRFFGSILDTEDDI